MTKTICPICHYDSPIWIGPPPTGCLEGNAPTLCRQSADRLRAEAMRRRLAPEAFEQDRIRKSTAPNGVPWVIYANDKLAQAGVDPNTGLLRDETRPAREDEIDDEGDEE